MANGIITTTGEVASLLTNLIDTQPVIASIVKAGYALPTAAMEGTSTEENMRMHLRQIQKG